MGTTPPLVHWALLTLVSAATATWSAYASHDTIGGQLSAVVALTLVNACLIAWVVWDKAFDSLTTSQLLFTATILGLIGMRAQPLLEDDHFRYLWDGYITATTGKPFAFAPSHYFENSEVPAAMRDVLNGINNPEVPTIYGPVLQALFAFGYWLAPADLGPFKGILLLVTGITLCLLRNSGVSPRWQMVFVLHPLLLKESPFTAHPDLLLGTTLLAAVLAWQRGLAGWAAMLACFAVAMKFSAAAVLPLFCISRNGQWSMRGSVATALTLSALYAPALAGLSDGEVRALSVFGEQWTFNPLIFKVAAAAFGDGTARWVCLALFALVWLLLLQRWTQRLRRFSCPLATEAPSGTPGNALPLPPIVGIFIAMLLLSPVVNPWYWLWVMPLALLRFSVLAWTAATVSLLAYAHVATQVLAGSSIITYAVPVWATTLQLLAIAIAAARVLSRADCLNRCYRWVQVRVSL